MAINLEITRTCDVFTGTRENNDIRKIDTFGCWLCDFLFSGCFVCCVSDYSVQQPICNLNYVRVQEDAITKMKGYVGKKY